MGISRISKRIYLDYAASTPVDPRVEEAMLPYFSAKFGNPSSLHSFGQEAIAAVDKAREIVAKAIGANFREVIFTSSATEANNLALRGVLGAYLKKGIASFVGSQKTRASLMRPKIIVSSIEHESILETCRDLEKDGVEILYCPVDKSGLINLRVLENALDERTILVSVIYASNEIGTVEPIAEIAEIITKFKKEKSTLFPLFHTDAAQAFQFLDCNVGALGVDLMTLSSHKIYGPKGTGALYWHKQISSPKFQIPGKNFSKLPEIKPLLTGGGQEFSLRSGTENVPSIVGFAKAAELVLMEREKEVKRLGELIDYFVEGLKKICREFELNTDLSLKKGERLGTLPNILNIYFADYSAEELLMRFDRAGIAVSAGAACSSRRAEASYVITALGYDELRARRSIRVSFGRFTSKSELDEALRRIKILFAKKH